MQTLPTEIHSIICSYLDDKSRRVMRLTNTEWFNRIRYNDFKFYFTTAEQMPQILARLAQYTWPIGVSFIKHKIQYNGHCEDIGKLTHLTSLRCSFTKASDSDLLTNLTNLECLAIDAPGTFARHFPKLRSLSLLSFEEAKILDLERFSNLEQLYWLFDMSDTEEPFKLLRNFDRLTSLTIVSPPKAMDQNQLTRFTNLKHLHLKLDSWKDYNDFNIPQLPNLESLSWDANQIGSLSAVQILTSLTLKLENFTTDLLSLVTLTNLRGLNFTVNRTNGAMPQWTDFLTALTNLENIVMPNELEDQTIEFIASEKLTSFEYSNDMTLAHAYKFRKTILSLNLTDLADNHEVLLEFSHLTSLQIKSCSKDSFRTIEHLTTLRRLDFRVRSDNELTAEDVLNLDKLTDLKELSAFNFGNYKRLQIMDSNVFKHMQLTKLSANCWPVTDGFLEDLAAMTCLQSILLTGGCDLTDESILLLTGLTNLTYLAITKVNDEMTGVNFSLLTSLQNIYVTGKLYNLDKERLMKQMPRLISVFVGM